MADPFIGEIKMVAFNFPPQGWASCDGATLAIAQNQALFSIVGATYGGDGVSTFKLPDLRGSAPVHPGGDSNVALGQRGGEASHVLTTPEMPSHTHSIQATSATAATIDPTGQLFAAVATNFYGPLAPGPSTLDPSTVATVGASLAHQNLQPFLTVNFIIALQGTYPSRN